MRVIKWTMFKFIESSSRKKRLLFLFPLLATYTPYGIIQLLNIYPHRYILRFKSIRSLFERSFGKELKDWKNMKKLMGKLEELLELGGTKKDIAFLII